MKKKYLILVTFGLSGYWINLGGQNPPQAGEIVITEIMANPEAVSDANGEWIEIFNKANRPLLLNGVILKDAGSNKHTLTSSSQLIIPPGAYWILAKNNDTTTNGGVGVDYTYSGFTLGNTADQVILCLPDESVIDQVLYESGWPLVSGASMELHPGYTTTQANDQVINWYLAKTVFGAGDLGSPGRINPLPAGIDNHPAVTVVNVFPNPTNGRFMLEAVFPAPVSGEIRLTNLIGQDFNYRNFSNRMSLREIVEADFLSPGIWFIKIVADNQIYTKRLVIE
ncbi:MAG: lamin tail domain-containing protein [Bacteroidota bacterium]